LEIVQESLAEALALVVDLDHSRAEVFGVDVAHLHLAGDGLRGIELAGESQDRPDGADRQILAVLDEEPPAAHVLHDARDRQGTASEHATRDDRYARILASLGAHRLWPDEPVLHFHLSAGAPAGSRGEGALRHSYIGPRSWRNPHERAQN